MSSKFNQRPFRRRRPPICIAPPKPALLDYDGRLPPKLTGFLQWLDLDPLGEMNAAAIITTIPRDGAGLYVGQATFGAVTLGVRVQDNHPAASVDVRITYQDPFWGLLTYDFPTTPMPLTQNFDTRLLTATFIPATDLRVARFME